MPALLPAGDESAMSFEGMGVFFGQIYRFPQHFFERGRELWRIPLFSRTLGE
jgi:hypothetical protein